MFPQSKDCKTKNIDSHLNSECPAVATAVKRPCRLNLLTRVVLALVLMVGAFTAASAQQTVFNVPTTDVLDKGKVYFEVDISAKPNNSTALSRFSSFVPRIVVGAGGRVEVGLNMIGNIQPGPDATTLVPTLKWKVYDGKDNGWAAVVGAHLYAPVHNRAYNAGTYDYLEFSKTFKPGTRVSFGGYFFSKNVVAPNANRGGGQFAIEQTVTKKLSIDADYFTGKTAAGYLTAGAVYKITNKWTGYAGYSIGNQSPSKGNHFFLFELGYNFN